MSQNDEIVVRLPWDAAASLVDAWHGSDAAISSDLTVTAMHAIEDAVNAASEEASDD